MITQSFKNGDTEIRFENAESLEDAKKHGFLQDSYTRFFINDKPVQNYMALVQFIVEETQRTGKRFIPPTPESLKELRREIIQKQNETMKAQYENLRTQYVNIGAPEEAIKQLDEAIEKIDLAGVRVVE